MVESETSCMIQSSKVGLAVDAMLVNFFGSFRGPDNETMTLLMPSGGSSAMFELEGKGATLCVQFLVL